uniref:Cyclooxygenase b-like protein n=1 Tax=Aspidosiphon laevis TaxID=210791 RepID=A0A0U2IAL0_9ANNE|nr:cyclooxygenase b-like protein [Aspidosiphon laevis]
MRFIPGTTTDDRFALGHHAFGLNPHHIMMGTVWMRKTREARIPSFNAYRKHFGMKPYDNFLDMAGGDNEIASELEGLYGDVDGVEFVTGLLVEGHLDGGLVAPTLAEVTGSFIYKTMMSSPLASPLWRRPSTFGGESGLDVIKEATLENLFCQNMKKCPKISFTVPASG